MAKTVKATITETFTETVSVEVPEGEDAEAFVHDLCNRNLIDVTASGSMSRNVAVEGGE